jgi:outer membrane protein assembly factor BamB
MAGFESESGKAGRLRGLCVGLAAVMAVSAVSAHAMNADGPADGPIVIVGKDQPVKEEKPKDPKGEKPKDDRPEHTVTLAEEPGVLDLLARAKKAGERAEKDPTEWHNCVKFYAEIMRKYPQTVYLHEHKDSAFRMGLYRSTRERVAADIAALPPAGLKVYQLINDPVARSLFTEARQSLNTRGMEKVAQDYFCTAYGDDALAWLAEAAYNRGAFRQVISGLRQIQKHPASDIGKTPARVLSLLALTRLGDKAGAAAALKEISELSKDAENGVLRVGHDEGDAALAKLSKRVESMTAGGAAKTAGEASRSWETYFGNAAHNRIAPPRQSVGVLKWSLPIMQLLYGPNAEAAKPETVQDPNTGRTVSVETQNYHIAVQDGLFYLCDAFRVVAYPIGNPRPGQPSAGNAKFMWPGQIDDPRIVRNKQNVERRRYSMWTGLRHHPYFCTVGGDRVFAVCGAEPASTDPSAGAWGAQGDQFKQKPNYIAALGWASGKLQWSLQTEGAAFLAQSKSDQEWLKTVYFTHAPTYANGVLYTQAVVATGTHEAWAAAFDAETGRLLWRAMICSNTPMFASGVVQPDIGLPVTVGNGNVYVVTNLGAVASLDASSGSVNWIRIYDRVAAMANNNFGRGGGGVSNFWGPNPPILYDNLLIITPQDSPNLYALNSETGGRVWEFPRASGKDEGGDGSGMKHVLGITHGALVLTGTKVNFLNIKNGKTMGDASTEGRIKGRGAVTEDMVLVSTDHKEKGLVRIDATVVDGKFKVAVRDAYRWSDSDKEAGNVFVAGDVLYTISGSHINAYFVLDEMERKLRARIQDAPGDMALYIELGDVYHKGEQYLKALEALNDALKVAQKTPDDPSTAQKIATVNSRIFDAQFALGESENLAAAKEPAKAEAARLKAYEWQGKAYQTALLPGVPPESAVIALRALAENAAARKDFPAAVGHYQQMILKHGGAVYNLSRSATQARLFAREEIDKIIGKDRKHYALIEDEARKAIADAGEDARKLQAAIDNYPNSAASGGALLKLAQLALESKPDLARNLCQRFLRSFGASEEVPLARALLASAYERSKMIAPARQELRRLTGKDFEGKTIAVDPQNLKARPTVPLQAAEWAAARLKEPQFLRAASASIYALGNGRLKQAWVKPAAANTQPLVAQGVVPLNMRSTLLSIENQSELSAIAANDKGAELWTPRPKLPANCSGRAVWSQNLLIMWGDKEIVAFDTSEKGQVLWRRAHLAGPDLPLMSLQATDQRVVAAYTNGVAGVLDSATGAELWRVQVEGNQLNVAPALGDGFMALSATNPARLLVYDLETSALRCDFKLDAAFSYPTQATTDRVYFCDGNTIQSRDGNSGKLVWDHKLDGQITLVKATSDLVVVILNNRDVVALNAAPQAERVAWKALIPAGSTVRGLLIDGDDLFVSAFFQGERNRTLVIKYSLQAQGKFRWQVETAGDPNNTNTLDDGDLTSTHVVLSQSNWDPSGARPTAVVLVDRNTGKLTWDAALSAEQARNVAPDGSARAAYFVQLFDGGLLLAEGKKRAAYTVLDAAAREVDIKELQAKLAAAPKDVELRVKLAAARFDSGDKAGKENAIGELAALLAEGGLDDAKFSMAYDEFARLRKEFALKAKPVLVFQRLNAAPKLDGTLAGWEGLPERKLEGWRNIFLAAEEDITPGAKKPLWKGVDDLKVSFRGAYDDTNLYLSFVVTDDVHKNDQTEGGKCDYGDSLKLVFDLERDGGIGWRGEDHEMGLAVGKDGKALAWRWVEHGRFLAGKNPIAWPLFAARNEAVKQTVYQLAVPLQHLLLKPESGQKFGFSFLVNDQDNGTTVEKGLGASSGILRPPYPGMFSEGIFQAQPGK